MAVPTGGGPQGRGRGVLPNLWLLPTKRLVPPNGAGPLAERWGTLPSWLSLPMERLQDASNGPRPMVGGTRTPTRLVVPTYGAPMGDGSPQRRGPTGLGDWETCLVGGCCLCGAYYG